MAEEFKLIKRCLTYQSKADPTNSPVETLVQGSQNVLINDQEKVKTRGGYSVLGSSDPYQGATSPGTLADDSAVGNLAWSNPSNASASDDSRAIALSTEASMTTHYLKATNFGFTIPTDAIIKGIKVEIEKSYAGAGATVRDLEVKIVKGGSIGSTNNAELTTDWPSVDAYTTYGSSSDLWGELWAASDINASNFGVVISASIAQTAKQARVDHIRITIYYSPHDEIEGAYTWYTSTGVKIKLRTYDDNLEIYTSALADWVQLATSLSAWAFVFATVWDTTELKDKLIMANGNDYLWDWSGGIATFASATTNTITKQGTNTWAQDRFYTAGTRTIRIVDSGGTWREFTYTGGETTTTLTGVSPDPTTFTFTVGANVFQVIRKSDNTPADGFNVTSLAVKNNQLWCGSNTSRRVYMSQNDNYTDFTKSTPRVTGEGEILTLDDVCRVLLPMDKEMWLSAGNDYWYESEFEEITVGTTLTEQLRVKPIRAGPNKAARSQNLAEKVGDYAVFINFDNELVMIGRLEDLEDKISMKPISDPVKTDFDAEDFSNGDIIAHKNRVLISAPTNGRVWINETRLDSNGNLARFWQPPQILPIKVFSELNGDLYGHSSQGRESYKLFDGTDDNGNSFKAIARYAYRNYGRRDAEKTMSKWMSEGYISSNAELALTLRFNYQGHAQILYDTIFGDDDDILQEAVESGSIGDNPLGDSPAGNTPETISGNPKFRKVYPFSDFDFFEVQPEYSSDGQDMAWELIALGGNPKISSSIFGAIEKVGK